MCCILVILATQEAELEGTHVQNWPGVLSEMLSQK